MFLQCYIVKTNDLKIIVKLDIIVNKNLVTWFILKKNIICYSK